jgi:hypothetical protein
MTKSKFDRSLKKLDEELQKVAGKPLDSLSPEEKADVVVRWALARRAFIDQRNSVVAKILYWLVMAIFVGTLMALLLIVLKWVLTLLGVI